ncbi:hypothetical protein DRO97_10160 [Archaeoglobales archaeon]|nr:MAG: hypothetical protein DRO97_10160 [Archaeoglobales archaeon]
MAMWFKVEERLTSSSKFLRAIVDLPPLVKLSVPRAFVMDCEDKGIIKCPLINFNTKEGDKTTPISSIEDTKQFNGKTAIVKFKQRSVVISKPIKPTKPTHQLIFFKTSYDVYCNHKNYYCKKGYIDDRKGLFDVYYLAVPLNAIVITYPSLKVIYSKQPITPTGLRSIRISLKEQGIHKVNKEEQSKKNNNIKEEN